jgi:hypothetical protein
MKARHSIFPAAAFLFALIISVAPFATGVAYASNITISTCTQLQNIGATSTEPVSGSYVVTQDIDCSATATWNPNGSGGYYGFTPIPDFTGTFNGAGFTISNLYISTTTSDVGLFQAIDGTSTVQNLNLSGGSITAGGFVGALAGLMHASATIQNVTSSVPIISIHSYVGGLVGWSDGSGTTIASSSASGSITNSQSGNSYIGGLIGESDSGTISNSHASGLITASGDYAEEVGGLAGYSGGIVTNSYATGNVIASGDGDSDIGGFIGYSDNNVTNSYATGSVTVNGAGSQHIGGLMGENDSGNVASSSASGVVTAIGDGSQYIGGLIGNSYGAISNSYATGNVIGTTTSEYVAGFIAEMESGSITQSYATGNVTGGEYVIAGFVGDNYGPITKSFSTGNIFIYGTEGADYVGGFIGYTEHSLSDDYATGNITLDASQGNSPEYVGGFAGMNDVATISNTYSTGAIMGTGSYRSTGGFAGVNNTVIVNSYSVGAGTGLLSTTTGSTGYFVGSLANGGSLINDAQFSQGTPAVGRDAANGGVSYPLLATHGFGTDEATLSNFYAMTEPVYAQATTSPWDFNTIWETHPNTFPTFQWYTIPTPTYTITASAGTGGIINNLGSISVMGGANQSYLIIPNSGYTIANVLVDGTSVGTVSTYTFSNVSANHTISVTFTATPTPPSPTTSGGGGSSGGSVSNQISNLLQNGNTAAAAALAQQYRLTLPATASPSTGTPSASTTPCTAALYPTKPIRLGAKNDPAQVTLLEEYLNTYEHAGLPVTGIYSPQDEAAVVAWQEKYPATILTPWHITKGTGYVYTTSLQEFRNLFLAQCQTGSAAVSSATQSTVPSVSDRDLQSGMSGYDVRTLQQVLITKNTGVAAQALAKNGASGYFGQLTKAALIEFQKSVGIVPSAGYYGLITRKVLN